MPAFRLSAALVLALALATAASADDDNAPFSSAPTLLNLCGKPADGAAIAADLCKARGYDDLAVRLAPATTTRTRTRWSAIMPC